MLGFHESVTGQGGAGRTRVGVMHCLLHTPVFIEPLPQGS